MKGFKLSKLPALMLVLALVFAMTACAGNNNAGNTTATNPPATNPPAADSSPTDAPAADIAAETTDQDLSAVDFNDPYPGADLKGAVIKVDWENPAKVDMKEADREKWLDRKAEVEEKFNCTLQIVNMDEIDWSERAIKIIESIAAGDPLLDMGDMSLAYWLPDLVMNDAVYEVGDFVRDYGFPDEYYRYGASYNGKTYGFTLDVTTPFGSLVFNRDMIKSAGMEMDPGEMFAAGRWSLDDFYNYLVELKSKLPDGVETMGVLPVYWERGVSFANDSYILNPDTFIPGYLEDGFIEVMEMYQKLVMNNIIPGAMWLEDQNRFTFGAVDNLRVGFTDGLCAITYGDDWDFEKFASSFDFGVVPYPWGSKVSIQGNDYTTLSSGYKTYFKDAGVRCFFKGSEKKATFEQLTNMCYTYYKEQADQLLLNKQRVTQGLPSVKQDYGTDRNFSTDLDIELWDFMMTRGALEPCEMVQVSSAYALARNHGCATNESFRTLFEGAVGEDIWMMVEYGFIDPANVPADMMTKAEAYHNANPEE